MLNLHRDKKFGRHEPGRDGKILSNHKQDGNEIQPEYGDGQADAGRDYRTRLARPNSQARTGTGNY